MSEKNKGTQYPTKTVEKKGLNTVVRKSDPKGPSSLQEGLNPARIRTKDKK